MMDDDKYFKEDKWDSDDDDELTKAEVVLRPEGSPRSSIESEEGDFVIDKKASCYPLYA